jgi:hypothetical protein
MQGVVDFLQLASAADMIQGAVDVADPRRQDKWRSELSPELLAQIRPHMEPTLDWLGYSW